LTEEAAPALHIDGSDIEVIDIEESVVRLRLHGACAGCPSTIMTIIMGLEQELRKRIPEIEYLEAVP
jgi:Fe-S cluster biogenesis protein NfuA